MDTQITANAFDLSLDVNGSLNISIVAERMVLWISVSADLVPSAVITVEPFRISISGIEGFAQFFYTTGADVWGSKIGELNFKLDESNEAFRLPTLSRGGVIQMARIAERVIVFSTHGIDSIRPGGNIESSLYWGREHISNHGLLSAWAFTDTVKDEVWFLDTRRRLICLNSNGFQDINCSMWFTEYDYVLTWDHQWNLLYISGKKEGFVYDPATGSLGRGINGITGITPNNVVVGHDELKPQEFEVTTNWYDLGTRSYKTIRSVEFSINTSQWMEAALDFRHENANEFKTTPWKRVNPSGIAFIPCYGIEFRIKLRSRVVQELHLDNIRTIGTIHGYDFLNAVGWAPNANTGA